MATNTFTHTKIRFARPDIAGARVLDLPSPLINGCIIDEINKELQQRNVYTTKENIISVLDSFTHGYPQDPKVIPLMTINYIEKYIKNQMDFDKNNFKNYNIWSAGTEMEKYGKRPHPEIKLRNRRLNPYFMMNY